MKIALFYHSLISDWNHGNAHFLRGITSELLARGHDVTVYEPADAWSVAQLVKEEGEGAIADFQAAYPELRSERYEALNVAEVLSGTDLILVHEWNSHDLVRQLGEYRAATSTCRLLFHDTHHRAVTSPEEMQKYDLSNYDGVLAYGAVLRDLYLAKDWTQRAWTWHEAADVRMFHPHPEIERSRDLVWIGNWGDDERTAELEEFLLQPVRDLQLDAQIHGVRYPASAREALAQAGIHYAGWVANFRAPETFAQFRVTVHVPRRPYVRQLPGIPTIRPFEALACGIPLISAPWNDVEGLFRPGQDFLTAQDGQEMRKQLRGVINDQDLAAELAANGLETILARHTCGHRVDELLAIYDEIRPAA
ncbi:MAG TPA: glycosyltransferase [Chthoniobacterales bacterium]|jgi:spore maturation protein CgeB